MLVSGLQQSEVAIGRRIPEKKLWNAGYIDMVLLAALMMVVSILEVA